MLANPDLPEQAVRRISFIREEMRFQISVLHDRINALISAEAFLLISFTMSLQYVHSDRHLSLISPVLALIGFMLAVLAWPGVQSSFKIIVEWNLLLIEVLNEAKADSNILWRPSVFVTGDLRTQAEHRNGLLFARLAPVVFCVAWAILAAVVLVAPWR